LISCGETTGAFYPNQNIVNTKPLIKMQISYKYIPIPIPYKKCKFKRWSCIPI